MNARQRIETLKHLAQLAKNCAERCAAARKAAEEAYEAARRAADATLLGAHVRGAALGCAEAEAHRNLAVRAASEAKAIAGIYPACGNATGEPVITPENRDRITLAQAAVTERDKAMRDAFAAEEAARDAGLLWESRLKVEFPE
jgi:hypothetical protein